MEEKKDNDLIRAYILAVVELGKDHEVAEAIKLLGNEVKVRTDLVFGEYDLVAVVESPSMKKLDQLITKIRSMDGVLKTITLIAS